jgi:hypothetical protein
MLLQPSSCMGALALLVSASLASAPAAQQPAQHVSGPQQRVTVDLATGTMTRGPVVQQRSASTCVTFNNLDLSGFISTDTGSCAVEWITQGVKSGGKSGLVSGFEFGYASKSRDTNFGGQGGQIQISFRRGYVKGSVNSAGATGTEVAAYLFTGLPANTNCSDFTDSTTTPTQGIVRAIVHPPLALGDVNIGWVWKFIDTVGSDLQAKTFPQLACIDNCNSGGPDSLGMTNSVDRYLNEVYLDTIAIPFATNSSSTSMALFELPIVPGQSLVMNGSGVNPVILSSVNVPEIGNMWALRVDCTGANPARSAIFRIGYTGIIPPITTAFGELLVMLGGSFGTNFTVPHGGGLANLSVPLPNDASLVCLSYGVQSLCGDTPRGYLSNALKETVGTP